MFVEILKIQFIIIKYNNIIYNPIYLTVKLMLFNRLNYNTNKINLLNKLGVLDNFRLSFT